MINRAALLVRLKQPFVDWVNEIAPEGMDVKLTLEEANEDRTIYLIDEDEAEELDQWLELNFRQVMECEFEDWTTDPETWPKEMTRELFDEWCAVECHTVIVDTVGDPIEEDEM